jgi:hypothetical protein
MSPLPSPRNRRRRPRRADSTSPRNARDRTFGFHGKRVQGQLHGRPEGGQEAEKGRLECWHGAFSGKPPAPAFSNRSIRPLSSVLSGFAPGILGST